MIITLVNLFYNHTALWTIVYLKVSAFLSTIQTNSVHTTDQVSCVELAKKVTVWY